VNRNIFSSVIWSLLAYGTNSYRACSLFFGVATPNVTDVADLALSSTFLQQVALFLVPLTETLLLFITRILTIHPERSFTYVKEKVRL
jgi:hypothetical protein